MTQENLTSESAEQPAEQEEKKKFKSPLPDGFGLTLAQAKALVAEHNKTVIADDEPALIELTILNAFLGELEKLHARHKEGLSRLMADKTDAYVAGVQEGISQLTGSLSSASVEGIRKVFDDHAARLQAFKNSTAWLAAIVGVSALLNVAVFVLGGLR